MVLSRGIKLLLLMILASVVLACSFPVPAISGVFPGSGDAEEKEPDLTMTAVYADVGEYASATAPSPMAATDEPTEAPMVEDTETATNTPEAPTASPTVTGTTTDVPTVQPVFITPLSTAPSGGQIRPAGFFVAEYLPNGVKLDGNWDEWTSAQYPANVINYGYENWAGQDDLSASFRVGWNEKFLFIAAKVKDDVYAQNAEYHDIYKGDSLEILLDVDLYGDFNYDELSADDYQLGISPGRPDVNGQREAYMWYPYVLAGSRPEVGIGAQRVDDVYRVEAAIPWTLFNTVPTMGQHFGFVFSVSDNDLVNSTVQQSMGTCVSDRHLTHPMSWGELVLGQ